MPNSFSYSAMFFTFKPCSVFFLRCCCRILSGGCCSLIPFYHETLTHAHVRRTWNQDVFFVCSCSRLSSSFLGIFFIASWLLLVLSLRIVHRIWPSFHVSFCLQRHRVAIWYGDFKMAFVGLQCSMWQVKDWASAKKKNWMENPLAHLYGRYGNITEIRVQLKELGIDTQKLNVPKHASCMPVLLTLHSTPHVCQ